jgi:hypothetical protein
MMGGWARTEIRTALGPDGRAVVHVQCSVDYNERRQCLPMEAAKPRGCGPDPRYSGDRINQTKSINCLINRRLDLLGTLGCPLRVPGTVKA